MTSCTDGSPTYLQTALLTIQSFFLIPFTINCLFQGPNLFVENTRHTNTKKHRRSEVAQRRGEFGSFWFAHFSLFIFNKYEDLDYSKSSHLEKKCLLFICINHELRVSQKLLCTFHTAVILADTGVRGCNTAHAQHVWAVTAVLVTAHYVLLVTRSHVSVPVWADGQQHTSEHNWSLTNNYT